MTASNGMNRQIRASPRPYSGLTHPDNRTKFYDPAPPGNLIAYPDDRWTILYEISDHTLVLWAAVKNPPGDAT